MKRAQDQRDEEIDEASDFTEEQWNYLKSMEVTKPMNSEGRDELARKVRDYIQDKLSNTFWAISMEDKTKAGWIADFIIAREKSLQAKLERAGKALEWISKYQSIAGEEPENDYRNRKPEEMAQEALDEISKEVK